jgi:beta-glucosidase
VAGSDVAQLYLNDPAASGEPPRQLKGFQKVTLRPGQSTTVHFTLSGQDLSYWDDTANGWMLPDGTFGVYVGDSSALANLPLHGDFTVDRTVGARYATVSAPTTVTPGTPASVTATLVNNGDYAMPQARFTLKAPAGWTVGNPAPVTIAPGQTVTEHFTVTAPANAAAGPQQRRRHHRDAYLRDGHRNRDADHRSSVLLARRRLRQHRDHSQRQPRAGQLRRHRGQLLR